MSEQYYDGEYLCLSCHHPTNSGYLFCQRCYQNSKHSLMFLAIENGKFAHRIQDHTDLISRRDIKKYTNNMHDLYSTDGINCAICGNDSSQYLLCKDCYYKKRNSNILVAIGGCKSVAYIRDLSKKEFEAIEEPDDYDEENDECEDINYDEEDEEGSIQENQCLICGEDCSTFHFCSSCYTKYLKSKETLIKIKNGTNVELLDSSYPTPYRCEDGHRVRSKSEREIDNYLFKNRITHVYEQPVFLDDESEEPIHPDFYLPDMDVFIEHLGMDITDSRNQTYIDQWNYKRELYLSHRLTVICTHEITDTEDIETALKKKLRRFVKGTINYEDQ